MDLPDEKDLLSGKPVQANWFVQIIRAIKALASIRGVSPVNVKSGIDGTVISLDRAIQPPVWFGKAKANAAAATVDGSGYLTPGYADVTVYFKDIDGKHKPAYDIKNVANYSGGMVTGGSASDANTPFVEIAWNAQAGEYAFPFVACGMPYAST